MVFSLQFKYLAVSIILGYSPYTVEFKLYITKDLDFFFSYSIMLFKNIMAFFY